MRATTNRLLPLLALVAVLGGCENGRPWAGDQGGEARVDRDLGPATEYQRRLLFLGTGEPATTATLDFVARTDTTRLERAAHVRSFVDGTWESAFDARWEMTPMRDPWRIVPHGDLKLVLTDAGELGALVVRGAPGLRVEPGPLIAETSPRSGTRLVLRRARVSRGETDGSSSRGVLLDSQLAHDLESGVPMADRVEAFLAHSPGYYAVVLRSADSLAAWISDDGDTRTLQGVRLEPEIGTGVPPAGPDSAAGAGAPTGAAPGLMAWLVRSTDGELTGRVVVEATAAATVGQPEDSVPARAPSRHAEYVLVGGWIEDGGVRRDVFGLVRRAR